MLHIRRLSIAAFILVALLALRLQGCAKHSSVVQSGIYTTPQGIHLETDSIPWSA